jgi:hypothetical protein
LPVLLDNDVLLKIAIYDLWEPSFEVLGITPRDVRILPAARFVFRLNKPGKTDALYGEGVGKRLQAIVAAAGKVEAPPNLTHLAILSAVQGIDAGEALLFAAAAAEPTALVLTGDKASLTALMGAASCAEIVKLLARRVMCWDQLLLRLLNHLNFDPLRDRLLPSLDRDGLVKLLFASRLLAQEKEVRAGLGSYILDIREQSGVLLMEED